MCMRVIGSLFVLSSILLAGSPEGDGARELYQRTEYRRSLDLLLAQHHKDPAALQLIGQNYFMLGEYKKGTDVLEKAAARDPENPAILYWLGRTYARRAETANPCSAPG